MLGSKLPSNGKDWHELRGGNVFSTVIGSKSQQISPALKETLNSMLHPNPDERPSAASLLERQELLSDEKRELLIEKERVRVANEALGAQRLDFERRLCGKPMLGVTMSRPIRQRLGKPMSGVTMSRPLRRSSAL
jgi:serine/threonine protein kinase